MFGGFLTCVLKMVEVKFSVVFRSHFHFAFTYTIKIMQEINRPAAVLEHYSSGNTVQCSFLGDILSLFQVIMELKIDHHYIMCCQTLRLLSHPLPHLPGCGRCSSFNYGNRFGTVHK